MSEVYDQRRTQLDTHEDVTIQTIESIKPETKPEEKSYIQQISEKEEIYTVPQSISETFNQTYTEDQLQKDNASHVNHPNLKTKPQQVSTESDEVASNEESKISESSVKRHIKDHLTAENTPETEIIETEQAKVQNQEKNKQGDYMEKEHSSSDYPRTKYEGEASEIQKGDEIAEEPLQQRPADIPYPEEKDEGPGLATKIAGAVAGVTVGGAILAYNKVKDAIGGNDEESEYPSEHQTPEAHYFEKHEQIMQEREAPPSYDEATKVQTFEDEHADPYLIQAKHEGGFEQSDENLTKEGYASPEAEEVGGNDEESEYPSDYSHEQQIQPSGETETHYYEEHQQVRHEEEASPSYNYATRLETHEDENDDPYLIHADYGDFSTEASNEDIADKRQAVEDGDALERTSSPFFSKQSKSEQLQNVSTTVENNYLNEKDVVPDRPQTPMETGMHEVVEEAEVSSLSSQRDQQSKDIKENEKSDHVFAENIFTERNEPSEHADPYLLHTKSENKIEEYDSKQLASEYPETSYAEEADKLQKGDEIAEEPLQQRPADIPYSEEKDEGPGLATKIAGAVAGVTVGGAILAYNK
uniref:Uncharacterized protein n=1 Tax=Panagrolaimus davidi TaxID=227884 RepID=A0A914PR56_9BILA